MSAQSVCSNCGISLPPGVQFCGNCGTPATRQIDAGTIAPQPDAGLAAPTSPGAESVAVHGDPSSQHKNRTNIAIYSSAALLIISISALVVAFVSSSDDKNIATAPNSTCGTACEPSATTTIPSTTTEKPVTEPPTDPTTTTIEAPKIETALVGETPLRGQVELRTVRSRGAQNVLVIGGLRGKSTASGISVASRVTVEYPARIAADSSSPTLLALANANPDAQFTSDGFNGNGIDINRNFPSQNWTFEPTHGSQALSESETQAIHEVVENENPVLVIAFLSVKNGGPAIDYNGAQSRSDAEILGAAINVRPKEADPSKTPGSLGSWFGNDIGGRIVFIYIPESYSEQQAWNAFGPAVISLISSQR